MGSRPRIFCLAAAATGLIALGPAAETGHAYRLISYGRPAPGPVVTYHASIFKGSVRRVVKQVNREKRGVRLVKASKRRADIRIVGAGFGCGGGLTNFIPKPAFGRLRFLIHVQIPRGCDRLSAHLTVAHEMSHALGLDHVRGGCVAVFALSQACKKRIVFGSRPLQPDDLRGIRAAWRNTRPRARIEGGTATEVGLALSLNDLSADRQNNIARSVWDFGDPGSSGNRVTTRVPRGFFSGSGSVPLPSVSHTYARPGTYTVTLTEVDRYGKRSRDTVQVTVTQPAPPPEDLPPPEELE